MDEKHSNPIYSLRTMSAWTAEEIQHNMLDRSKRQKKHWLLLLVSAAFASLLLWRSSSRLHVQLSTIRAARSTRSLQQQQQQHQKVPLEAHIMSKCPDAKDCLHDLVLPAMQRVHDKVDFKLSFIGTYV